MTLTDAIEVFIILYGYDGAIKELDRLHAEVTESAHDNEDIVNTILTLEQFLLMKRIIERLRDEKQADSARFPGLKKSEVIDS